MPITDAMKKQLAQKHRLFFKICRTCGSRNSPNAYRCRRCRGDNLRWKKRAIGDSLIMMADATPKYAPIASQLYVHVENVDMTFKRGLDTGASSVQEPADQFYGDRTAGFKDPTGNYWWIAQRMEEVSAEELERRLKARSLAIAP